MSVFSLSLSLIWVSAPMAIGPKSPWYAGGDLMVLYQFVRQQCRRQLQTFVQAIASEKILVFFYFWLD